MKKIFISSILISVTYIFSACSGDSSSTNSATATANTDSSISADKKAAIIDTANKGKVTVDNNTLEFANKAATGGMTEVQLGKLAKEKATNPQLKDFAVMMMTDHTLTNENFKILAASKSIQLPVSITNEQQKDIDALSKKSGKDFDKAYVDLMIDDHKATIMEFKAAEDKVSDNDIKSFITSTLPTLQKHLDAIKTIKSKM